MSLECGNSIGLNCQLKEMLDGVYSWLSENREHLEVFSRFADGFHVRHIDQYSIAIDGLLNINPDVERRYLNGAVKEEDKRIRLKMLAALGVYIQNSFLICSVEDHDAIAAGAHMYFSFVHLSNLLHALSTAKGLNTPNCLKKAAKAQSLVKDILP